MTKKCVSLFSNTGFGDLGLESVGFRTIVANELLEDRAELFQQNFPDTNVICGDIWEVQDHIVDCARTRLNGERLYAMIISCPCQAMSSNGMGRMTAAIKQNKRERDDPRNRLILPAIEIVEKLNPVCVIIENVSGMRHTCILNENNEYEKIMTILYRRLPNYVFRSCVLNTCDYGVPQNRKRLITIAIDKDFTNEERIENYFSDELTPFHPSKTHGNTIHPHITLGNAIKHLPKLDALHKLKDEDDTFHRVPMWNQMQYFAMQHTNEDDTAFNNKTCVHCGNITEDLKVAYCFHCNELLPRPVKLLKDGTYRVVKAFKTAYRRQSSNRPANTLTMNSGVISSDVKGHYSQNRVLSLREIMIISSLCPYPGCEEATFEYEFPENNDKLVRECLGEAIPPLLTYKIACHICLIANDR
jgi:DNA (cytosine-5)-methyltransferase 1